MASKNQTREMDNTAATIVVMALVIAINSAFAYVATLPARHKKAQLTQPAPDIPQTDSIPAPLGPEPLAEAE